tara:strand:- start:71 stop:226 length:156 start_codon:yes stop_codon:yes gene_type:complete
MSRKYGKDYVDLYKAISDKKEEDIRELKKEVKELRRAISFLFSVYVKEVNE